MTFINPYNFASLGEQRSNAEALPDKKELLIGYLECELKTLTPLLIPNTSNPRVFKKLSNDYPKEHACYEFFSYEDLSGMQPREGGYPPTEPIIPGSSIRGALRSAYEALTNSCMSTLTDVPLHSRVPNSRKPGLLFCKDNNGKEEWFLQPAERYCLETSYNFKDATEKIEVWYKFKENGKEKPWQISLPNNPKCQGLQTGSVLSFDASTPRNYGYGNQEGVVLLGEHFNKKKGEHLFVANDKEQPIPLYQEDIERLEEVLRLYRDTKTNKHTTTTDKRPYPHNQYTGYDVKIARESGYGLPVYYDEINIGEETRYYLSPGNMSRSVYYNQLSKMARTYRPCSDPKDLCPACSLFGMVGEEGALGSRVRVGDARRIKGSLGKRPVTLLTLLSPKLSSMEFYSDATVGTFRTYDYETTYSYQDGKPVPHHRIYTPDQLPYLRGRKMYWHAKNRVQGNNITPVALNVSIRPVEKEAVFSFRLYFDRVSETDLKRLVNLLVLTPELAHKLGRGKPLGFGSVRIKINKAFIRSLDIQEGVVAYPLKPSPFEDLMKERKWEQFGTEEAMEKAFELFARDNQKGYQDTLILLRDHINNDMVVQYPGYQFFSKNRGPVKFPKYQYVLPHPSDSDLSLPLRPNN